jgi:protein-disulfide isomerase
VRDSAAAAALALLVIALVVDVGLLALQAVAIKAFCLLCLLTYALNAAAIYVLAPARRALQALRGLSSHVEGRLLLAGWVAGSLAVAAATAGAQSTLTLRASARGRALIGMPNATAPAPAAPTTTASALPTAPSPTAVTIPAGGEAQHYKQLAEKLQQTLDDPQKLDQYFRDKATQEFDQAPVQSMDLTEVPSKGTVNAPVQIVEYLDFLCPPCRQLSVAIDSFLPQAGNRVAIYYKNYPLDQACNPNVKQSLHPGACWLAMGGICSGYQGKYAVYQSKVMTTDVHNPGPTDVIRLATEAGVNATALEACINDPRTKQRLTAEIEEARRVGVSGTPTFFINGKKLPRIQDFVPMVDKEAQKKGSPPLPSNLR